MTAPSGPQFYVYKRIEQLTDRQVAVTSYCQAARDLRSFQKEGLLMLVQTGKSLQAERCYLNLLVEARFRLLSREIPRVIAFLGVSPDDSTTLQRRLAQRCNFAKASELQQSLERAIESNGRTRLHRAAMMCQVGRLQKLIAFGVPVNAVDEEGSTPLMGACARGDLRCAEVLLRAARLRINQKDFQGRTALILAALNNQDQVVTLLMKAGADLNGRDQTGQSALVTAAKHGHPKIVKLLLSAPTTDPNSRTSGGKTGLMFAASSGCMESVELFLAHPQIRPDQKDDFGNTAVCFSIFYQQTAVLHRLLQESNATIDRNNQDEDGATLLHYAVEGKSLPIVARLLCESAVDIDRPDNFGRTPLMAAVLARKASLVRLLVDNGADLLRQDQFGMNARAYTTDVAMRKLLADAAPASCSCTIL
jgi:ankyrin repeat protein